MKRKYVKPIVVLGLLASLAIAGTLAYLTDVTDEIINDFTVDKKVDIELTENEKDWKLIPGESFEKDPTIVVVKDASHVFTDVVEKLPSKAIEATDAAGNAFTFGDYVKYEINGLYSANPKVPGGSVELWDEETGTYTTTAWYWMEVETVGPVDGTYDKKTDGGTDAYTEKTTAYALVDVNGKLLTVSSKDKMTDGSAAVYPILKDNNASIPSDLTQAMLQNFIITDSDPEATYSADLAFTGYAIQTTGLEDSAETLTGIKAIYADAKAGTDKITDTTVTP